MTASTRTPEQIALSVGRIVCQIDHRYLGTPQVGERFLAALAEAGLTISPTGDQEQRHQPGLCDDCITEPSFVAMFGPNWHEVAPVDEFDVADPGNLVRCPLAEEEIEGDPIERWPAAGGDTTKEPS